MKGYALVELLEHVEVVATVGKTDYEEVARLVVSMVAWTVCLWAAKKAVWRVGS